MVKKAKFIVTEEGEFALVITEEGKLRIIEVETEEEKTYSKSFVEELINFLDTFWEVE